MLVLANKNVFWKNCILLSLYITYKLVMAISKVLNNKISIFWVLMSVDQILTCSFNAYTTVIILILLPKLIKANILPFPLFFSNCTK